MPNYSRTRWTRLLGATTLTALALASLLPTGLVPRTGLGWQTEHFLAYLFTATVLCIAWPRPPIVAISLIVVSALLESLQGLTPDRIPDITAALLGAGGAISAAVLVNLFSRARTWWLAVTDEQKSAKRFMPPTSPTSYTPQPS